MNELQQIKRLLLPAIKGSPIILAAMFLAIFFTSRIVRYKTPMYESTARMKLDDARTGISDMNLFTDFDVFTASDKVATEVEVLVSRELIRQLIGKLTLNESISRVGKLMQTRLYKDSPFTIESNVMNNGIYKYDCFFTVTSDTTLLLNVPDLGIVDRPYAIGEPIYLAGSKISINFNLDILKTRPNIDVIGQYTFRLKSDEDWIDYIKASLDVKAVDDEIAVVRISFRDPNPQFAADVVNHLAQTYITDYVTSKSKAADKTVEFINQQLDDVGSKLRRSEEKLEQYKLNKDVVNTYQETETGLREISQMKIFHTNLLMKKAALDSLNQYINGRDVAFNKLAPQFDAFGDILLSELIKQHKLYEAEREDLLQRYTTESKYIKAIDRKIESITVYIKEAVQNAYKDLEVKEQEIKRKLDASTNMFETIPTREREMLVIERELSLYQNAYNFLMEKRTEADIVKAATISFHRIIDYGKVPRKPVSPNKKFLMIVAGFSIMLFVLAFIYIRDFLTGTLQSRQEIEERTGIPISGVIPRFGKMVHPEHSEAIKAIASHLMLKRSESPRVILLVSTIKEEGKSFLAEHLAKVFHLNGKRVLAVDMNDFNPTLSSRLGKSSAKGLSDYMKEAEPATNIIQVGQHADVVSPGSLSHKGLILKESLLRLLAETGTDYDYILIDTPAAAYTATATNLVGAADEVLFVVRAGKSKAFYLEQADEIHHAHPDKAISVVLNSGHQASNFNGRFVGSRFSYTQAPKGVLNKIKHYLQNYL